MSKLNWKEHQQIVATTEKTLRESALAALLNGNDAYVDTFLARADENVPTLRSEVAEYCGGNIPTDVDIILDEIEDGVEIIRTQNTGIMEKSSLIASCGAKIHGLQQAIGI